MNGKKCDDLDLSSAYLVGTDDVPLRGEFSLNDGILSCRKRAAGPAGLVIPWRVADQGCFLLETARLMERVKPYVLQLELVRGRLIRVFHKVEEWGLYETEQTSDFTVLQTSARELLLEGMLADSDAAAAATGDKALRACLKLSEDIVAVHAHALLQRRRAARAIPRHVLGAFLPSGDPHAGLPDGMEGLDYIQIPLPWRMLEPQPQKIDFHPVDEAISWAAQHKLAVRVGPLLSFDDNHLPEWLSANGVDFGQFRDLAHEHIKRVVNRLAPRVLNWSAVGGINLGRGLPLSFDQIIELTRMAVATVKRLAPNSPVIVDIEDPWGEYYATNNRSIPPGLYAEMMIQSGIPIDGFGVRFSFGQRPFGRFLRDFFQISTLMDKLSGFNRPLHVTVSPPPYALPEGHAGTSGWWREPWNEKTAGEWLQRFFELVLSKPLVESVCLDLRVKGATTPGREQSATIQEGYAAALKSLASSIRPGTSANSRETRGQSSPG